MASDLACCDDSLRLLARAPEVHMLGIAQATAVLQTPIGVAGPHMSKSSSAFEPGHCVDCSFDATMLRWILKTSSLST